MRSLVSYLNEKSPQDLRTIAESWQASLTDRLYTGNTFQLSQEMQSEFLQRRLLEKLGPDDLNLLALFVVQPEFTLDPARQEADFPSRLTELKRVGLIFEDRAKRDATDPPAPPTTARKRSGWSEIYGGRNRPDPATSDTKPVWIVPRELGRPLARLVPERQASNQPKDDSRPSVPLSRQPLTALVARLEPEILELQAENWGVLTLIGQAEPPELAQELSRALVEKSQQERVLGELSEGSQNLFRRLVAGGGGRTTVPALLKEYISLRRLSRDLRPLTEHLLVWEAFEEGQSLVFVPSEIATPTTSPSPARQLLQTVTPPSSPTPGPQYALAWDILTYLNYLSQNTVELTNNGYIPKRDLKKLGTQLWPWSDEMQNYRVGFLTELCRLQELYKQDGQRLITGPKLDEWLGLDFYEQMRRCLNVWLQNSWRIGPVSFPYYYGKQEIVNGANRTMLGWLADCEPEQWYDLTSLQNKIQREDPYFILPRRELLNGLGSQRLTELSKMWPRLEGEIIHQTFATALEWLGIVRTGREPATGRVTAFQVTEFGASVSGRPEAAAPVVPFSPKPLLVQPDFEVLLLSPQVEIIWQLEKFTNLRKLDLVSLYSLTREALLRGLESSLTRDRILEWLEKNNAQPLPQNLSVSLADWSRGFKRVAVEQTTLLEVEDAEVLDELLRSKQYAEYFVRRLSPTAAVIKLPITQETRRTNSLKTFKSKLKSGGFFAD